MTARIFIDGAAGTTGLEIHERLGARRDLQVVTLDDASRKDAAARKRALNEADVVILCLPDDAARQAVAMIENPEVRVIDASTAHRVADGWTYGFAEMDKEQRAKIAASKRVSNPGCYPTGFIALLRPLIADGLLQGNAPFSVNAVSGYSGGGKAMIEEFEKKDSPTYVETVSRIYALTLAHKHVAEMQTHTYLSHPPVFAPSVGRYYRGMIVEVPLNLWSFRSKPKVDDLQQTLEAAYKDCALVKVASRAEAAGLKALDAEMLKNRNDMKLFVFGNDDTQQARLVAVLDNLGKGAGGAAVQNLNIMLGLPETEGLI
ncbi:MAG TPA: N-acetyl-gamma-glutamyl-phosphate reductase [Rhizomicrobium sp.]|nr:N-acetyl-gamma-glutamyl-phosphate reductase [Rhizomicrobium sp.]